MKVSAHRDKFVLTAYLVLAVALTYPLVLNLGTHVPGRGVDDPALTWNLWWVQYAIFHLGASPLSTNWIYYPVGVNLVAYTSTFLNAVLTIPLQLDLGAIIANNMYVYFALVLSGYGMFLLMREILARQGIKSVLAPWIAGAFYAFGAWHISYVAAGHFMLLSNQWLPFFALYVIRTDRASWKSGALAGFFFVLLAWTELTFIPFAALFIAAYLIYLFLAQRRVFSRRWLSNWAALALVAGVGVSPLALSLLADTQRYGYYLAPGLGRVQVFSAEPISFLIPSPQHPLLGNWGLGLTNANTSYAFVGYAALLFAAVGLQAQRRSRDAWFWAAMTFFFALLMLGPTLIVNEQNTNFPLPFAALRVIPFVNANRYPVRFNIMLMLALSVLIAYGVARLQSVARAGVLMPLALVLAFEQLVLPIPVSDLRAPAIFKDMRAEAGEGTVLDLPLGWRNSVAIQGKIDYKAQFLQTIHQKRLLGGLTSRNPLFKFQYYLELPVINSLVILENGGEVDEAQRDRDRAAASKVIRFFDIRYVEANRALTDSPVLEYARDILPMTEIYHDTERIVYRIAQVSEPNGAIDLGTETNNLYFDDQWGRPQAAPEGFDFRWAANGDAHLWLPLAQANYQLTLRLRGAHPAQKVTVRANEQTVGELTVNETWNDFRIHIPAAVLREGLADLVLTTDVSPLKPDRSAEYVIGETGAISPVDVSVTSAGFDAGRFGEIWVAGRSVIPNQRGYHLAAIDARTGRVDQVGSFDTFGDPDESARLARFVEALPIGEIVAGAAIDDVSRNLQPQAVESLRTLGAESDLRFTFRAGHAFIGVKGTQPGQALEQMTSRWPANVAVGKNVRAGQVSIAVARIEWEQIQP